MMKPILRLKEKLEHLSAMDRAALRMLGTPIPQKRFIALAEHHNRLDRVVISNRSENFVHMIDIDPVWKEFFIKHEGSGHVLVTTRDLMRDGEPYRWIDCNTQYPIHPDDVLEGV